MTMCFRTGSVQTELYKYRRWLEAGNFGFRKKKNYTSHVAKTKALISFAVSAPLFSHVQNVVFLMPRLKYSYLYTKLLKYKSQSAYKVFYGVKRQ